MYIKAATVSQIFLKNRKKFKVIPGTFWVDDDGSYTFEYYSDGGSFEDRQVLTMSVDRDFVAGIEMAAV